MKGLVSLKVERSLIHHELTRACARRGFITDWWAIATPPKIIQALPTLDGPYRRRMTFAEFLAIGEGADEGDLDELERRYGTPTLWPAVLCDRRLFSLEPRVYAFNPSYRRTFGRHRILRTVAQAFRAAERVLDEWKPDVVILESCGAVDEYALYSVATQRGIAPVFMHHSRIRNRWYLARDPLGIHAIHDLASALARKQAPPATADEQRFAGDVIGGIRKAQETANVQTHALDWVADGRQVTAGRVLRFPLRVLKEIAARRGGASENPYVPDLWTSVSDRVGLRWRTVRDRRFVTWEKPTPGERYVYFPLQMQPEVTTTLHAPAYIDQVNLVEVVARALPLTHRLYVKDHPVMIGCRPRSFYERLARVPSVRLIDPRVSSQGLIRDSLLTVSITGTATWEAAAMGKPAVLFAPTLFDRCRGVAVFDQPLGALPQFLADVLAGKRLDGDYGPEDFLVALQRQTFAADTIGFAKTQEEVVVEEVEIYAAALEQFIRGAGTPPRVPRAVTSAETST